MDGKSLPWGWELGEFVRFRGVREDHGSGLGVLGGELVATG